MSEDQGFTLFIGLVIISICIGTLHTAVYGWLTLGIGLIIMAFLSCIWSTRNKKRRKNDEK